MPLWALCEQSTTGPGLQIVRHEEFVALTCTARICVQLAGEIVQDLHAESLRAAGVIRVGAGDTVAIALPILTRRQGRTHH